MGEMHLSSNKFTNETRRIRKWVRKIKLIQVELISGNV